MELKFAGPARTPEHRESEPKLDLDALLHPAQAFAHPRDVANDPDLTLNEKRAILASWASDACAIEAAPALRQAPGGRTVQFDDVMDALRALDRQAAEAGSGPLLYRPMLGTRRDFMRRGRHQSGGRSHGSLNA